MFYKLKGLIFAVVVGCNAWNPHITQEIKARGFQDQGQTGMHIKLQMSELCNRNLSLGK